MPYTINHRAPAAALLAALAGTASGDLTSWTNASGGFWNDGANWSAGVPNSYSTTAEIDLAGNYTVILDLNPVLGELRLTNPGAVIAIPNGRSLFVSSDTLATADLVNDGTIVVNSNQGINATSLVLGDGDTDGQLLLSPGMSGVVVLNVADGNGDVNDATLTFNGAGFHGQGHAVRGKGRITGAFTNNGVIVADRDGQELRIQADVTQGATGIVAATGGGRLGIGDNGVVSGGTLTTDSGGRIGVHSGTGILEGGAHNTGDVDVLNSRTMRIDHGGITNDGTITVNSNQGINTTYVVVATASPVLGTGNIDLNVADGNGDINDATLTTDGVTATNGPDHAVTGKGRVTGSWINEGRIEADRAGQELRIQGAVTQSASGVIGAANDGVLGIGNGGRVSGGSVETATGGSVQASAGVGFIDGGLTNLGAMGVRNGSAFYIDLGGIINDGVITVNSNQATNTTDLRAVADVTIGGTGAVDLNVHDGNGDFNDARLITDAGVTATIGADQSVTGKGRVTGAFTNNGTIDADRPGQDIRLSGAIDQGPAGMIMGSNGGVASPESVTITGGFFDGVTGAVLATGGGNAISGVTSLGAAGLRNGAAMSILAGGLTNHGLFTVNSQPGINTTDLVVAEDATIDGTGRIELNIDDGNGDFNDARLYTAAEVTATNDADHTIAGKGQVIGAWVNRGTLTGDRAGQDLRLVGTFDQPAGGEIRGDNAGFGVLAGATVTGGSFDSSAGGAVHTLGGSNAVSGVTNLGEAGLRDGSTLDILSGGFANNGTCTVNTLPGISWTVMSVVEDATIGGTGEIVLNLADGNGDYNDCRMTVATDVTATHDTGHTIRGKGRISGSWINNGTIAADRPGQDLQILAATMDQGATGVIRADDGGAIAFHDATVIGGTFDSANAGAVLFVGGTSTMGGVHNTGDAGLRSGPAVNLLAPGFTNDGTFTINANQGISWTIMTTVADATIDGAGTTHLGLHPGNGDLNDCRLRAAEGFTLTLGENQTLSGRGWLQGDIVLEGPVAPGSDDATRIDTITAGPVGASGAVTFASTTEYRVQASAEEVNDRIASSVPVVVDGTLRFTPIDGFDPPRPTRYTIVTAPEVDGEFDTLIYEGTLPEGGVFRVVYEDTEVIAAVTCKADIAAPIGVLDLSDINIFVQLFLVQSPLADLTPPFGVLDLSDINTFVQDFLAGCGP